MKSILTCLLISVGSSCFAQQLASEKPLNQVFSQEVKQKLDQPKTNAAPAKQLPSQAPMPRQVVEAKKKVPAQSAATNEERRKKLPSNQKKMPVAKAPKK